MGKKKNKSVFSPGTRLKRQLDYSPPSQRGKRPSFQRAGPILTFPKIIQSRVKNKQLFSCLAEQLMS
jgi:hypothetical protein